MHLGTRCTFPFSLSRQCKILYRERRQMSSSSPSRGRKKRPLDNRIVISSSFSQLPLAAIRFRSISRSKFRCIGSRAACLFFVLFVVTLIVLLCFFSSSSSSLLLQIEFQANNYCDEQNKNEERTCSLVDRPVQLVRELSHSCLVNLLVCSLLVFQCSIINNIFIIMNFTLRSSSSTLHENERLTRNRPSSSTTALNRFLSFNDNASSSAENRRRSLQVSIFAGARRRTGRDLAPFFAYSPSLLLQI